MKEHRALQTTIETTPHLDATYSYRHHQSRNLYLVRRTQNRRSLTLLFVRENQNRVATTYKHYLTTTVKVCSDETSNRSSISACNTHVRVSDLAAADGAAIDIRRLERSATTTPLAFERRVASPHNSISTGAIRSLYPFFQRFFLLKPSGLSGFLLYDSSIRCVAATAEQKHRSSSSSR